MYPDFLPRTPTGTRQDAMRSLDFPSDDLARNDLDRFQHPCPHVQRWLDDYRDGRLEAVRQRDFKGRPNKLRDHATDLGVHFRDHPPTTVARAEVERLTGLNRYLVGHLPRPWPFRRRSGRRVHAPDPPTACRRSRCRFRRDERFPPHSNGVGSAFQ